MAKDLMLRMRVYPLPDGSPSAINVPPETFDITVDDDGVMAVWFRTKDGVLYGTHMGDDGMSRLFEALAPRRQTQ